MEDEDEDEPRLAEEGSVAQPAGVGCTGDRSECGRKARRRV